MSPWAAASSPRDPRRPGLGLALLAGGGLVLLTGLALAVALARLGWLAPRADLRAAFGALWSFRDTAAVRHALGLGAAAALSVGGLAAAGLVRGRQPRLHGAARWATAGEIARAGLRAPQGILLGRQGGRPLALGGEEHVLLYAPTRTGKGVGVVIPNLLAWPGSVVVLDVKRENWQASAGFRAAHGQETHLFDPLDAQGRTARFNPLGHIDRTEPGAVLDELQKLAVMLFPAPPHADPFWAEAARTGFIGVGAFVAETPDSPFSLGAIYAELTRGEPRARLAAAVARRAAEGRPLSDGCQSALGDFCSASENTFASIKQTITARMNLWLSPRVCAATAASDFDLRDLRDRPMSIYLAVSPDNLVRVAPLYNLLFQQLVDLNTRERPGPGRHPIPVLVLLDEFARLGHAEVIAKAFAFVAGYGLRLLPVLQSPAQLRAEYGPDLAEEIIANCGTEVAFAPKELRVARDLSERLGAYTYPGRSRSRPTLFSRGGSSTTTSDQRRPLMLPQELMQMPADHLIVLRAGLPPVRGRKIVYWRERAFRARLQPPPAVAAGRAPATPPPPPQPAARPNDADADRLARALTGLDAEALASLPPAGAPAEAVEAWVRRFIDAGVAPRQIEAGHGR